MVDIAVGNNPSATPISTQGIMTWLTCDSAKMDLYQTVKLKRQLVDSRTSPDSAGDDFRKGRSLDSRRGTMGPDPRVFDGGGNEYVSSSPMEIETSREMSHPLSPVEEMSTTPHPPDTSDRKVDIQSTIHIAPIFASTDEGCSLGAGGTGGGDLMASVGSIPPSGSRTPISSSNNFWGNRYNGSRDSIRTISLQPAFPENVKNSPHDRLRTPKVIIGESGGVKTMMWTTSLPPSPQPPFNTQGPPREILHSPVSSHFGPDTSEAVLASVDGLLSLGQDRRVSSSPHNPIVRVTSSAELFPLPSSSPSSSYSHYSPLDSPRNSLSQNPPLNMERLWAGERTQLSHSQVDSQSALNLSKVGMWGEHLQGHGAVDSSGVIMTKDDEDDDQPMICMICDDKATGLHYGIITCEGCKGFFKRTVQNKRVYTCVADGECEITKAQRNRCQFCRFNKCINQGMVLEAVREDRMPGGRNSGAVYNKYKIKYKKKKSKNGQIKQGPISPPKGKMSGYETVLEGIMGNSLGASPNPSSSPIPMQIPTSHVSPHSAGIITGNILKTALTNPAEVAHFRRRIDNNISTCSSSSESIQSNPIEMAHLRRRLDSGNTNCSSMDSNYTSPSESGLSPISASNMIKALIDCDDFENLATLRSIEDLLDHKNDFATKLCELGDSIGMKLVSWTKKLPFYKELSDELHAHLLTSKWHEILVLASSAYQAIYGVCKVNSAVNADDDTDFRTEMSNNLCTIQSCLTTMMGRHFGIDSIRQEVELMIEKLTHLTVSLRRLKIQMEEYVCLKVIVLLQQAKNQHKELEVIQERYVNCLKTFCQTYFPSQPTRVEELLVKITDIQEAAGLLLASKLFYVPFLMCSKISR